ncbi:MAG: flavodoxin [Erysipelotrichaceae bacterium]|nr:flavodoxin [Erysipelotrichaceae bacterium]
MKKIIYLLTALLLVFGLAACGTNNTNSETPAPAETAAAQPEETAAPEAENTETGNRVLVIYFSATGTTRDVAEKIAGITGADLYEILAKEEYTSADLNWNDSSSRTTIEQNDKNCRPEIGSAPVSLEGYTMIYIGYPIWWGEEPRILDTFVESHDFTGITVVPFCTSSSSGIGRSGKNLAENAGTGSWLDGKRFGAGPSKEDLMAWISGLQ